MCAACVAVMPVTTPTIDRTRTAPACLLSESKISRKRPCCSDDGPPSPPATLQSRKVARLDSLKSSSSDGSDCSDSSVCSLVHGVMSVKGGRPYMEDTYSVQPNLVQIDDASNGRRAQLNFYSVYDGHGGDYVANHCSETLHQHFKHAMDERSQEEGASPNCVESALLAAFQKTDQDLRATGKAALVGSTAVVVVVDEENYWVANCGDSRAILCRNGACESLTEDHKPEREDERTRIKESGGFIVCRNGVVRVMGALSVSRAIGDHVLQRYGVTWKPEIYCVPRCSDDEFCILASDGLFSVLSNEEATQLARKSLLRARHRGATRDAAARIAANVLTKVALHRGAQDNVTVVVVDLLSGLPVDNSDSDQASV